MKKIAGIVRHFLFQSLPVEILGFFRIAIASFALIQVVVLLPDWMWFFGPRGLMPWLVSDTLNTKGTPSLSLAAKWLSPLGLSDTSTVYSITLLYVVSLIALIAGIHTRVAGFVAWLCHMVLNTTGHMTAYGVETFTHIALFYCMVLPVGAGMSIDSKQGRYKNLPEYFVTLSIRLIQVHLCIIYCASGIEKAIGNQWWNGDAIWISLQQDQFRKFDTGWLAQVPVFSRLMGWATLITETLYPIGIFWKPTKKIWFVAIIGMHLFIMIFLGLYLFGGLMIILNVTAFGFHCYPHLFSKYFLRERPF